MNMKVSAIGAITGDVIGSRFEFENIKTKDFELFDTECCMTDDGYLTLAVGEALLLHPVADELLSRLTCLRMRECVFAHKDVGFGGGFFNWASSGANKPYNSWGNGAAMRVSMCGWAGKTLEEVAALSDAVTRVTHNHPEGMAGARITAQCVFLARTGVSIDEMRKYVNNNYRKIDFTLDQIRPTYKFDESCQGTVPQALESFFESTSFEDAVKNAISLGGDADTLGAICGAVAGAYWKIPAEIVEATRLFMDDYSKDIFDCCEAMWV